MNRWHKGVSDPLFSCILRKWRGDPPQTHERQTVRGSDKLLSASHTTFLLWALVLASASNSKTTILSVYCHYDGYPSFNGKVLRDFYDTKEKASQLINGGNMSCTGQMQDGRMKLSPNLVLNTILLVVNLLRIMHLVWIKIWRSSSLIMKNILTSSATDNGLLTICISGMITIET